MSPARIAQSLGLRFAEPSPRWTRYHEAGHVLAAQRRGARIELACAVPIPSVPRALGHTSYVLDQRLSPGDDAAVALAGIAAECIAAKGPICSPALPDFVKAWKALDGLDDRRRLYALRSILDDVEDELLTHWHEVQDVARQLARHGCITERVALDDWED